MKSTAPVSTTMTTMTTTRLQQRRPLRLASKLARLAATTTRLSIPL
jgi:hypothetical protein